MDEETIDEFFIGGSELEDEEPLDLDKDEDEDEDDEEEDDEEDDVYDPWEDAE